MSIKKAFLFKNEWKSRNIEPYLNKKKINTKLAFKELICVEIL